MILDSSWRLCTLVAVQNTSIRLSWHSTFKPSMPVFLESIRTNMRSARFTIKILGPTQLLENSDRGAFRASLYFLARYLLVHGGSFNEKRLIPPLALKCGRFQRPKNIHCSYDTYERSFRIEYKHPMNVSFKHFLDYIGDGGIRLHFVKYG